MVYSVNKARLQIWSGKESNNRECKHRKTHTRIVQTQQYLDLSIARKGRKIGTLGTPYPVIIKVAHRQGPIVLTAAGRSAV